MKEKTKANNHDQSFHPSSRVSEEALKLWNSKGSRLKELMEKGQRPDNLSLDGWEFLGLNVGLGPRIIGRRKFIKYFYLKDYGYGRFLTGNNFMVRQNNPADEYIKKIKKGKPVPEGYFLVEYAELNERWNRYPRAALLHYGRGNNAWYEVSGLLRDYVVQPYRDNPNILLGRAYFALGPLAFPSAFFVLERSARPEAS